MLPRVSVVVPTYNRPHLLEQALRSLTRQSMGDFEVLIGDNADDEATAEVVRRLGDGRFHYCPRPHNVGMLKNVLLAVEQGRAPLWMKLDDDDILEDDALAHLVPPLEAEPEVNLAFGNVLLVDEHLAPLLDVQERVDKLSGRAWFPEGLIRPATWLVAQGGVQMAGAVLRRNSVDWDAFPESVSTAYDLHLCLSAVAGEQPVWFTREQVARYRIHSASDTHIQTGRQAAGAVAALEIALASGRHGDVPALHRRLALATLDAARGSVADANLDAARAFARRSFQLHPSLAARRLLALSRLPNPLAQKVALQRRRRSAGRMNRPTTPPSPSLKR